MKKLLIALCMFLLFSSDCYAEDAIYLSINDVDAPIQENLEEPLGANDKEDANAFNLDGAIIPDVQPEQLYAAFAQTAGEPLFGIAAAALL